MAKPFTFASRLCPVVFFEENPITVLMTVGDECDKRIIEASSILRESDNLNDLNERMDKARAALDTLIGEENAAGILDRADTVDSLTVMEIYSYVLDCYREHKTKNLIASAR